MPASENSLRVALLGGRICLLNGCPGVPAGLQGSQPGAFRIVSMVPLWQQVCDVRHDEIGIRDQISRFGPMIQLGQKELLIETQGTLEGFIAETPIGENGFGYDPIFFVPRLNKTVAQLAAKQKNSISHRGSAIRKLKPLLDKLLERS